MITGKKKITFKNGVKVGKLRTEGSNSPLPELNLKSKTITAGNETSGVTTSASKNKTQVGFDNQADRHRPN